jgi:hypothetical protein
MFLETKLLTVVIKMNMKLPTVVPAVHGSLSCQLITQTDYPSYCSHLCLIEQN